MARDRDDRVRATSTPDGETLRQDVARSSSSASASDDLYALSALAGVDVRRDVHECVVALVREKVVPTAIAQVVRSLAMKASEARDEDIRATARRTIGR